MYDIAFVKPKSLKEALEQKNKWGKGALFIAGGSNMLIYLKDRKIKPNCFIDISELEELRQISVHDETVSIGPSVRISEIEDSLQVKEDAYILHQATNEFGNPLIKNKGTIGGNIADASPAADMAPPLLVLDAYINLASIDGKRKIPLHKFFLNPRKTAIKDNEMISEITFSKMKKNDIGAFIKLGNRNATTISVVSIAVWLSKEKNKINNIRVALGSVAPTPIRSYNTEKMLQGSIPTDDLIQKAMDTLQTEVNPISDVRATADYRREISAALFKRAIHQCMQGANHEI